MSDLTFFDEFEASERFRLVFENAPFGIALTDSETSESLAVNTMYASMLGLTVDELRVWDWRTHTHSDDLANNERLLDEMRRGEIDRFRIEKRYLRDDGSWAWVDLTVISIPNADGTRQLHLAIATDITAQRAAEEERSRLAAALDSADDALWTRDLQGFIRSWNGAAERMFGYRADEIIGRHASTLVPPGREFEVAKVSEQMVRNTSIPRFQTRRLHKDGHSVEVALSMSPIIDARGMVVAASIVAHDITAYRTVNRSAILGEQRFRTLFGKAPMGVALVDSATRIVLDANESYAHILGRTLEQTRGIDWADITHPDDLPASIRNWSTWRSEHRDEAPIHVEKRYVRPDGSTVWVEHTSAQLETGPGETQLHLGMIVDITERKRAEARLAESERRYRLLADHGADVVMLIRDGVMEWVAPSITAMLGYSPEELVGQHTDPLVHPDDQAAVFAQRRRREAGEGSRVRMRGRHKDGHWVWLEYSARPLLDEDGQPEGSAVMTMWNIEGEVEAREALASTEAERRRLEAAVQQATRLESIGVLAGGVAHDFNNLLVGILGNTELAIRQLGGGSPMLPLLQSVAASAQRAAGLTRQLLDYAGHRPFDHHEPIDPRVEIRQTLDLVVPLLPHTATVVADLADGLPAIECDRGQLQQVVMNLVINAADALDGPGTIEVTARARQLDADEATRLSPIDPRPHGRYLEVSVTDDGRGMDHATVTRVFEPFFSTKEDGRGLGLAAVYGIVRSNGGMIDIASTPGDGTTMRVLLPASERPAVAGHDDGHDAASSVLDRPVVLLVDDDADVLEVCRRVLETSGCAVVAHLGGAGAIAGVAAGARFDVALIDMSMPGLGGADVLRALRVHLPDLPAVMMSGYSVIDTQHAMAGMPIDGFVHKPFRAEQLVDAVRRATRRRA